MPHQAALCKPAGTFARSPAAPLILRAATFPWQEKGPDTLEPWNQFLLMVAAILLCTALAELARRLDLPLSAASWRRSSCLQLRREILRTLRAGSARAE